MASILKYGVIGYGYWGPNLVRVFNANKDSKVIKVCDSLAGQREKVGELYPAIETCSDPRELISDSSIDVIVVATPVSSHYPLALEAIKAGKHILIEKPMAMSTKESRHLVEMAHAQNVKIMVDHTFVYTGAVQSLYEIIADGSLGEILYYDSTRVNLGLFQKDVNVLWDLVIHDIAILDRLMTELPIAVSAIGMKLVPDQPESIVYFTLYYDDNKISHVHASWLAPVKIRQTLIGGTQRMVIYDDLEPSEKLKIYDKGIELVTDPEEEYRRRVSYRSGDMYAPQVDTTEALSKIASHFNDCIINNKKPLTDGEAGMRVIQILEAAELSMSELGRKVTLEWS